MTGSKANARVVIVGAGPVGMVCALALNKLGVPVTVFEQEPAPVEDQARPAASIVPGISTISASPRRSFRSDLFRAPTGFMTASRDLVVAEFDLGLMKDEIRFPYVLQYEQYKLTASIAAEYGNASDFDVRFSHAVTGLTQGADGVEVEVTSPSGIEELNADYVIGCDGGRSTVRKLAGIEFEGFTYPERFIKIATSFDFGVANPKVAFRNYFSDPTEWCNLFKVQGKRPRVCGAPSCRSAGRDRRDRAVARARRGAAAEILSQRRPLRDRVRQRLWRASMRRRDLPQGPRAARRRQRPCQQSDRRHGHERRHP